MPIEIKELHIKISIDEKSSSKKPNLKTKSKVDNDTLIASCVEAVLEILEHKKER